MTHYIATFSDGSIVERKHSAREYSHAWLVRWKLGGQASGFARTQELAERAAGAAASSANTTFDRKRRRWVHDPVQAQENPTTIREVAPVTVVGKGGK